MTPPPDPGTNGPGEAASELGMPPSSSPPHPSKKAAAPPKKVKFSARGDTDPDPALALLRRVVESTLENSDEAAPTPATSTADSDLPPGWLQQAVRDIFAVKSQCDCRTLPSPSQRLPLSWPKVFQGCVRSDGSTSTICSSIQTHLY